MERSYSAIAKSQFRMQHDVRVRFNELDRSGVVYSANYLVYADIGVTEYFRALGEGLPEQYFQQYLTDIIVLNAEVQFHVAARLDEVVTIGARVARFGRTGFTLHCALFRGEERLSDMALSFSHVGLDSGEPEALPGSFIAEVRRFEAIMPVQE
ncbi:MAG: acyl-CoA thioesterase [Sphingopyxis sp.]|nr:acyl-CoA thioesterase [Sphingopyxis sp.]